MDTFTHKTEKATDPPREFMDAAEGEAETPARSTEGESQVATPAADNSGAKASPEPQPLAQEPDQGGARLVRRRGWFQVGKAEIALLNERCGAASASAKAVWLALLCLANDRQSLTFTIEANVIASLAGVCLRTTKTMLSKLEALEFVGINRHYDPSIRKNDPSTYTLLRSCNKYTTPSCNKRTRGRANEVVDHLHASEKESAKAFHKKRSGERSKRPSEGALSDAAPELLPHPRPW